MRSYLITGAVVGAILAVAPTTTSAESGCFGSWERAANAPNNYLVGRKIDQLLSKETMTVSKNACVNYGYTKVRVANPNGKLGLAPHLR